MQRILFHLFIILSTSSLLVHSAAPLLQKCTEKDSTIHPILCDMVEQLRRDPLAVSQHLHDWAKDHHLLVDPDTTTSTTNTNTALKQVKHLKLVAPNDDDAIPVVFAHGMGDSCFNSGMQRIVAHVSELLNVNVTCIPLGATQTQDTNNGYFLNMDASIQVFAEAIQQDPKLSNGFHSIGFSQGNNVIRGYIAKYNDPPVHTFLSINGVNAGEGAVPYCRPKGTTITTTTTYVSLCDLLMEQASRAAYTDYAQQHSFQANYWRDPRESEFATYQQYSQLAKLNNEGQIVNQTLVDNYSKTSVFVWIMANDDNMVWPKEGEQWGAPDPKNPFQHVLPREETAWFTQDLFGLKSADDAGKNYYESFDGDHLQFTMQEFDGWINKYLVCSESSMQ